MSTQKWESVTWEWLEREIVDCLLAGKRRKKSLSLARMLTEDCKTPAGSTTLARKQAGERTNG
jgi:hypothetical protein